MYILLYLCTDNRKHAIWKWTPAWKTLKHLFGKNFFLNHSHKTKILLFFCDQNPFEGKRMEKISHSKSNLISLQSPIYFMLIESVFQKKILYLPPSPDESTTSNPAFTLIEFKIYICRQSKNWHSKPLRRDFQDTESNPTLSQGTINWRASSNPDFIQNYFLLSVCSTFL